MCPLKNLYLRHQSLSNPHCQNPDDVPFKYGFSFDWLAFFPIAIIYLITAIESTGDLTANCMISRQPIQGEDYLRRIKGGVLGDGFNSMLAAVFNTFPNTTFSQNNAVIQLTGVASRYVGYFVAGILVILGLFPVTTSLALAGGMNECGRA
ncbi:solute carrier family 23 protein [Endozoicomonas sp. GU-1]|uniref:solute carrier family 23 protein n=1 Tax=Endozoicomonas sp. GU-1 TaxID=3009078 RepID=UPI002FC38BB3